MKLEDIALLIGEAVKIGNLPDMPDQVVAIFDYSSEGDMRQYFNCADSDLSFQVRVRDTGYSKAYERAAVICQKLARYCGNGFTIRQTTPVLDIGQDTHNPPRREFTINFKAIRRT